MRWFGPSWDAPVCEEGIEVQTPIGQPCEHCGQDIVEGDQGLMLAYLRAHTNGGPRAWSDFPIHLDCLTEMVSG